MAFPSGVLLYNFDTSESPKSQGDLALFELFRKPLLVIGILDAAQYSNSDPNHRPSESPDVHEIDYGQAIAEGIEKVKAANPDVLVVQPVIFDYVPDVGHNVSKEVLTVPPLELSRSTTMKTVMCDVSARLLSEMSVFAQTIQAADHITSPGASATSSVSIHSLSSATDDIGAIDPSKARPSSAGGQPVAGLNITMPRGSESDTRPATSSAFMSSSDRVGRSSSPVPSEDPAPNTDNGKALTSKERVAAKMAARSSVASLGRDASRDRRSKQANALYAAERAKQKLASRQGLIIGNLHLMAGRWADALRELIVHTGRAKVFGDQIWYAKGLENILVTMLLLAWARLDFAVPSICLPGQDRVSTMKQPPSSNLVRSSQSLDNDGDPNTRTLINLAAATPDLVRMIIDGYNYAAGVQEDRVPQYTLSECIIRMSYLLAVLYRSNSSLSPRSLAHLVQGVRWSSKDSFATGPGKAASVMQEISAMVFDALPSELFSSSAPLSETITILSGMISVLSFAGLYRKRAMLIRETLSMLIPKLIQARKVGAAELGIHPAASLAARHGLNIDRSTGTSLVSQGQIEQGFHNLLTVLCDTYGVVANAESGVLRADSADRPGSRKKPTPNNYIEDCARRQFGGFGLKSDVLRLCANFSEALPNFADVIHFTASLIKSAGPGNAPAMNHFRTRVHLPGDEQRRFLGKIERTLSVFKDADASQLETEYWDPFAVRKIEVSSLSGEQAVAMRKVAGFVADKAGERVPSGPFLYNPAQNAPAINVVAGIIVANASATFSVILQNLYDVEIVIQRLELVAESSSFEASLTDVVLRPSRLQKLNVSGIARRPGDLLITGCRLKVQGCREQVHSIYTEAWNPDHPIKIKETGLEFLNPDAQRKGSSQKDSQQSKDQDGQTPLPSCVNLKVKVIDKIPSLVIESSTVLRDTIAIMDGETQEISISVRNISEDVPIDFLELSFEHTFMQESNTKRLLADEQQPMRLADVHTKSQPIAPGSSSDLQIEIHGMQGLASSKIFVDYGYVGSATVSTIYTRRATFDLQIDVAKAITVARLSVLPAPRDFEGSQNSQHSVDGTVLAFDLYNGARSALRTSIWEKASQNKDHPTVEVQPQETQRLLLRLQAKHSTESSRNEVDTNGADLQNAKVNQMSTPIDKAEDFLKNRLQGEWTDVSTGKKGILNLSHLQLPQPITDSLINDQVRIDIDLTDASGQALQQASPKAGFSVAAHEPFVLRATYRNCSDQHITPIIHFQPHVASNLIVDVSKYLTWSGSLERCGELLQPGQRSEMLLGLCATNRGSFDIEILATQAQLATVTVGQRPRSQEVSTRVLGSAICRLSCTSDSGG